MRAQRAGELERAVAAYRRAIEREPQLAAAHDNMGVALRALGQLDDAIACHRQALALDRGFFAALNNLGEALRAKGDIAGAITQLRRAVAIDPEQPEGHLNLGAALIRTAEYHDAVIHLQRAIALDPRSHAAWLNLGTVAKRVGDLPGAVACFERALAIAPGEPHARMNLATTRLLAGELERGWQDYDARLLAFRDQLPPPASTPAWDGSPLDGATLLVQAEQGFGDAIEFARYVPMLRERGAGRVLFECRPPLHRLFQSLAGVDELISTGAERPPFDAHIRLLSLPRIFGTTIDTIPGSVPYLSAPAERLGSPITIADSGTRVGIVWRGNSDARSIPARTLAPILDVAGCTFHSLQKGPALSELAVADADRAERVIDLASGDSDLADAAYAIERLDLVITIDTAIGHLAGAMGKRVWVMLAHVPDWRWMLDRIDSPWYPTARLFRQRARGDWNGVARDVAAALTVLT